MSQIFKISTIEKKERTPSITIMPGPEHDVHFDQYEQCYALYEQENYTECTQLCIENIKDATMPIFFHIKTRVLLAHAADKNWLIAEVCYYCPMARCKYR
jgi:hypothetical protein